MCSGRTKIKCGVVFGKIKRLCFGPVPNILELEYSIFLLCLSLWHILMSKINVLPFQGTLFSIPFLTIANILWVKLIANFELSLQIVLIFQNYSF